MSLTFDEWIATATRREAAQKQLASYLEMLSDVVRELRSVIRSPKGDPHNKHHYSINARPNWPSYDGISQAVREYSESNFAEAQRFQSLTPSERSWLTVNNQCPRG